MATTRRRHAAFTLVELLVVITIIGMLVALLLPAVQGARERGRQLTCLNNVKNISLAAISYDSSKGQLPGYTQLIKVAPTWYATINYDSTTRKFTGKPVEVPNPAAPGALDNVAGFSWATMLLSRLERNDIWDQIVQPNLATAGNYSTAVPTQIPPVEVFVCPSDRDVTSQPELPGLTYSMNTGGWDPRGSNGQLTLSPTVGDKVENGIAFDLAQYDRQKVTGPKSRMSAINDGAGTTLMFAENSHKLYDSTVSTGEPAFGWLKGNEQQLGFVWVVPTTGTAPVPGNAVTDQEALNRDSVGAGNYIANAPRFARPASPHSGGMNVAFCDGHGMFLRDDIDYVVYQQLVTPNGRKSVNPANKGDNGAAMTAFRNAPPLAEKDYQ